MKKEIQKELPLPITKTEPIYITKINGKALLAFRNLSNKVQEGGAFIEELQELENYIAPFQISDELKKLAADKIPSFKKLITELEQLNTPLKMQLPLKLDRYIKITNNKSHTHFEQEWRNAKKQFQEHKELQSLKNINEKITDSSLKYELTKWLDNAEKRNHLEKVFQDFETSVILWSN